MAGAETAPATARAIRLFFIAFSLKEKWSQKRKLAG
jgi:hypothetical protein